MHKFLTCLILFTSLQVKAQYYYKDLITTQQINDNYRTMKTAKVATVTLKSFVGNNEVTEGFDCNQKLIANENKLTTYTKTSDATETFLTAFYNKNNLLIKTIDSSANVVSTSTYTYDAENRLINMENVSRAATIINNEIHKWQYNNDGKPIAMQKIRNGSDTTFVTFVLDEKGHIAEERAKRKGAMPLPTVYYYYDEKNRLSDVVRYNQQANRLLPDYIFEYDEDNRISVMTLVPEGSDDYQKWYYKYDEEGLKVADFCYNKRGELLGKILYEYRYSGQ